jgi:hypothetical protein
LQLAAELRGALPGLLGPLRLKEFWAFKYDSGGGAGGAGGAGGGGSAGIAVHADDSLRSANLWLTPPDRQGGQRGGLVVYSVGTPPRWSFELYNGEGTRGRMLKLLRGRLRRQGLGGAATADDAADADIEALAEEQALHVPYRSNRVVVFSSCLFHRTDEIRFRRGFGRERINLTFLFGSARAQQHPAP